MVTSDRPAWGYALIGVLASSLAIQARAPGPLVGLAAVGGMHWPVLVGAWATSRRLLGRREGFPATAIDGLLAGTIYFAATITIAMLLGFLGLLTRPSLLAGMAIVGLGLLWMGRGHAAIPALAWSSAHRKAMSWTTNSASISRTCALVLRWATAALILIAAIHCLTAAEYPYDVLTYHLTFPAQWSQEAGLGIVPTWFGDPAPAYAPAAMEVYYATLLLPAGGDWLARCGQFPAYLLLLLATSTLSGALRVRSIIRAGLILIVAGLPGIAAQASTAMVDVALAAFLVAAAAFALRLQRSRSPADATGLALAIALAAGTKFVSIVYLAAFVPLLVLALLRFRPVARFNHPASIGVAAAAIWIGGYWYLRNWLLCANPLYPMRVAIGPWTLFDGAFGREAMSNHIMNARRSGGLAAFLRVMWQAIAMDEQVSGSAAALGTLGRFAATALLCAIGLLLLIAAWQSLAAARGRIGDGLCSFGSIASLSLFWFAIPAQIYRYAWGPVIIALACAAAAGTRRRTSRFLAAGVALVLCVIVFNAAVLRAARCWIDRGDARDRAFQDPRWVAMGRVWGFVDAELKGQTIAYCGNNVPYFLYGRRLENRVVCVPARRPMLRRFDQFARQPESRSLGEPQTSEPAFDRWVMDPAAWLENLRELGVEYFVVNSLELCPNLTLNVRHDAAGFPIERAWLDALARAGAAERISFSDPRVLVYRLHLERLTGMPAEMQPIRQAETDAFDRLRRDSIPPGAAIPEYPLAGPYIESHDLRPADSGSGR